MPAVPSVWPTTVLMLPTYNGSSSCARCRLPKKLLRWPPLLADPLPECLSLKCISGKLFSIDVSRLTVSFEILAAVLCSRRIEPGCPVCAENKRFLRFMVWHGDSWRSAILIDASLSNNALNAVAVPQSLTKSLEHNSGDTFLLKEENFSAAPKSDHLMGFLTPLA